MDNIEFYKKYIKLKNEGFTMVDIAKAFKFNRSYLYKKIEAIEKGDTAKINNCFEKKKLECLLKHKYETRIACIPKNRKSETITLLHNIIREMLEDGFNSFQIAKILNKNHTTILHHIKNETER